MKKIALIAISLMFLLTGCGKKTPEDLIGKFEKNVNNSKSYTLKGNMEILSNEETFTYSIEASYLKDNFYKVTLVNQTNNHEQVILRNKDGVYVITPSLNKSFKFQSEWPNSSSQSYILASIINDIKNNPDASLEEINKGYVIQTKVNYPNNSELTYQKVYFDKNMNLESVEVYDNNDVVNIKMVFTSINFKSNLKEEDFSLDDIITPTPPQDLESGNKTNNKETTNKDNTNKETTNNEDNNNDSQSKSEYSSTPDSPNNSECVNEECDTKTSNILDSIIYPLYIPSETYLSNSEKIDTDDGNRVILTFAGDKNFVLIEEVANVSNEFEIIPVYGDPVMLSDTIAAKSANSMYWTSNNISYYLTSNDLSTEEMVTIAESLGNVTTVSVGK